MQEEQSMSVAWKIKQNKNTISSVQLKYKFNMAPLKIYSFDCTD